MKGPLAGVFALLALLCPVARTAAAEVDLEYSLQIERPETGVGRVTMKVSGLTSDGLRIVRSSGLGESWFDQIRAADSSGKSLAVAAVQGGYYVTTEKASNVTVSYMIKPGGFAENEHLGLICGDYAALDGSFLFLVPGEELDIRSAVLAAQVPANWKPAANWLVSGDAMRPNPSSGTPRIQLERSLICFGDFALTEKKHRSTELKIYCLSSYPAAEREQLAATLHKIYGRIADVVGCDTGRPYNVVCLPPAPDGLPVVAGAWADGQALTLAGTFPIADAARYTQYYGRLIAQPFFSQPPFGITLRNEDRWLYPAVAQYAEGLAVMSTGKVDQNVYFAEVYSEYAAEALADSSLVDVPVSGFDGASPAARAFIRRAKALILLMRLDFEIRVATDNQDGVETFLQGLCEKARAGGEPVDAFEVVKLLTGTDFEDFKNRFVRDRQVLLPTWPAFLDRLGEQKTPEPGEILAEVNGLPIYVREVEALADDMLSQGTIGQKPEIRRTALTALVNEKLMDEQLAQYKINVVPEAFWRLRLVLPGKVTSTIITAKRHALRDILYNDWLTKAGKEAKIDFKTPTPPQ